MNASGVRFGTSGARGLAEAMTDFVCYTYTRGFLQYLESVRDIVPGRGDVAIAGDLRPSTDRIMRAVRRAVADMGYEPLNCGRIPSPAVALFGIRHGIPAVMVTGSHIPADRNGIKFNKSNGEILKEDEVGIRAQQVDIDTELFDETGTWVEARSDTWPDVPAARDLYLNRYLEVFPANCLRGRRIGVYQHSAVGRDLLVEVLDRLGADVVALGRSDTFVPVDTEAIRDEDVELAQKWARQYGFDAMVSTDGDSDRPLVADENGQWLRGDVAGILCARYLGADSVSTPVSCNTAVEKCHFFREVRRTRIGSPFVIAAMQEATAAGAGPVVGYEANGGFLLNSDVEVGGKCLPALPTRDALILQLSILLLGIQENKTIAELVAELPPCYTASGRLQDIAPERSRALLARFDAKDETVAVRQANTLFARLCGNCLSMDYTDGVRMVFESGEIVHLRPSGNAPEFRCYCEAVTAARAADLCSQALEAVTASL